LALFQGIHLSQFLLDTVLYDVDQMLNYIYHVIKVASYFFLQNDPAMATDEPSVLAIIDVIGGVDNRPKLDGVVKIDDNCTGTICKVTLRGKILVQMNDGSVQACRVTSLVPVSNCS
jgi:hypothetical protein